MTSPPRLGLSRVSPSDADAVYRACLAAQKQGLAEETIPLLESAVRIHPNDPRMWQLLGLAWRRLEDLAPAVEALDRAALLAPRDALIAHSVARVTMEAGLPAADLFERALVLAPADLSVRLGRAASLFAEGEIRQAIDELDAHLRQVPGWLAGHATLARLRWMSGDRANFTASFEAALRLAPREAAIWLQLAATLMEGKLHDRALDVLDRAQAAAGPNPLFDAAEAACLTEQGEIEKADRLFVRLGEPRDAESAAARARHLLKAGRPAEAGALAEAWQGRDPGHLLWPYAALAWRLTGDPRWQWLEGDERFIGVYDIADKVGPLDLLAGRLRALHLATHQPLEQSVRDGTQTDGPLFARIDPEIRALRQAIVETVRTHVAQLPAPDPSHPLLGCPRDPIRFSGSWSVRLSGHGHHVNHVHPAGWISSAFYVALPDEIDAEGPAGWLTLGEAGELGLDLPPIRLVQPRSGRLVLFPSTMWHGTRPFEAGERLTVAFDVSRPTK